MQMLCRLFYNHYITANAYRYDARIVVWRKWDWVHIFSEQKHQFGDITEYNGYVWCFRFMFSPLRAHHQCREGMLYFCHTDRSICSICERTGNNRPIAQIPRCTILWQMCTCVLISVKKWCILRYLSNELWDLWNSLLCIGQWMQAHKHTKLTHRRYLWYVNFHRLGTSLLAPLFLDLELEIKPKFESELCSLTYRRHRPYPIFTDIGLTQYSST